MNVEEMSEPQLRARLREINMEMERIAPLCAWSESLPNAVQSDKRERYQTLTRKALDIEKALGY